jgi:hypothetical protein
VKRKKNRSIASYRAAALKARRTIKLMQQSRQYDRLPWETESEVQTKRALPNPWFDMGRR